MPMLLIGEMLLPLWHSTNLIVNNNPFAQCFALLFTMLYRAGADNVFLQNKLFKKCFEIHHATLCETNHGFHAMSLLTLSTFSSLSLALTNISATSIFLQNTSLVLKRLQYLQ